MKQRRDGAWVRVYQTGKGSRGITWGLHGAAGTPSGTTGSGAGEGKGPRTLTAAATPEIEKEKPEYRH